MKRSYIIAGVIIILLAFLYTSLQKPSGLSVTFFDVGQGDSELIRTPAGQVILIDGGPDRTILSRLGTYLPWTERTIDLMVLSHPHADHASGLIYVLERYQVRHVLMTGVVHTTPEYLKFLDLIKQQRIPVTLARTGQKFSFANGVSLEVLWPRESYAGIRVSDLNSTSIVNTVRWGESAAIFTGDTPLANEQAILAAGLPVAAQLLKVAHQGSQTSSSEDFIRAVAPEVAVISVGANNQYGHPHPEVVARLRALVPQVFRTDQDGNLTFISDGVRWHRR